MIAAMIQKAYDTLVVTVPSVYKGNWEVLYSPATLPPMVCLRWSRSVEELAVQLAPWIQFPSDRKGSATRGLIRAPRPMKKCKA